MPNHVINEITFAGCDAATVAKLRSIVLNGDGEVDFEVLVPAPLNIWNGSVGTKHTAAFPDTHLDWATKNWSTKWNAYGKQSLDVDGEEVRIEFQTAWRPPYGWLVALFNTMKRRFVHKWMSEGHDRGVIGVWEWEGKEPFSQHDWNETDADPETQKYLHLLLWGVEEFAEEQ